MQSLQEISRIRKAIIPAAESLKAAARSVPYQSDFSNQTRTDIKKIRSSAKEFRACIDHYFPTDVTAANETAAAEMLKSSRHDAKNVLNRTYNLVELLGISEEFATISSSVSNLSNELKHCLSILDNREFKPVDSSGTSTGGQSSHWSAQSNELHPHPGVVLVADDDEENRLSMQRRLEPIGHTVHFAKDGVEVIKMISNQIYDAVLLDIQMPKMDGFEVLAALRESGHLRMTPVIVVTALDGSEDAVRCIEIGAEDFLSRPLDQTLLMARLNACLEKKRLREQVFEQHFTPELARELARNPDPMKMQARHEEVSILFCDIRKFSTISEQLGPTQTVDWLSNVMGEFSTRVIDLGGVLVDYTGDELMAMWGAPNHQPNHAELACEAALSIMQSLESLNEVWEPKVGAKTSVGIGVNTGEALVGNIGTHRKFKYGPLGTCINLASRVQGATKYLKTPLLITGNTAAKLSDDFKRRRLCSVRVNNISEPVELHELVSKDASDQWVRYSAIYEEALTLFEARQLPDAYSKLGKLDKIILNDGPSLGLMRRLVDILNGETEFDPVWELPGK